MLNVYDLIRLSGVIINGVYLYNNTNELYEINIYNIFTIIIISYLIMLVVYPLIISILTYLLQKISINIVLILKYEFFKTDRNKETDIKNILLSGIFCTGVNCIFILTNSNLFPEWLHFICTPLFSSIISLIYLTIKNNLNILNIIYGFFTFYTSNSLALNLPNLIIKSFIDYIILTKLQELSSSQISNILNFTFSNIGFIFLGIHFYNNPFSLKLIDENEIVNYIIILISCLIVLNIMRIFGLFENISDSNPTSKIFKVIQKETIFSFITVMSEEALFLPLYNEYHMYFGIFYTKIILSIIFGLLHIPSRNWKSSIFYIITEFILLQFNFSLINRMIGHYLYDIILFCIFIK